MENTSFLHGKQIDKAVALLGGTKFELDRKTLDSTYYSLGYKLDGITCYKNNEYRAISVPNVPKELLKLLESSPYRGTYFTICGKDVLITSLEGLVYLDTLKTAKLDDLEEEFNKNTRRVRLQLVNEILAASSVVDNAKGDNNPLRDELNLFDRLAFGPLVVDDEERIPKYLENYYFNYTGFYKKGATNDCIEVDWAHKSQKIMGKFNI